jgi:hypothetical protein
MIVRATSINWQGANSAIRNVAVSLEKTLQPLFKEMDYGGNIDQFTIVAVIFSDDDKENENACVAHDEIGSYKNWQNHDTVRYVSFAVPLSPGRVELMNEKQYRAALCQKLIERLNVSKLIFPISFNYKKFSSDMNDALRILLAAD